MADPIRFLDLRSQHQELAAELMPAIEEVLEHSQFVLGEQVEAFETEFAAYCGTEHCVTVNSGTDALRLTLLAAGIGPGDEVVTVSHTFVATAVAIWSTGATAVFVDIDPATGCLDPGRAAEAIGPATRAIVPVHLYGRCLDVGPLLELARAHELLVLEDAAQAHGAEVGGRRAGAQGTAGCFSFYPAKNLGAWGDGGAVVTDDAHLASQVRLLRNYGEERKYEHPVLGYNSRLDELQAAVLRVKLRHLDRWNEARRAHASAYARGLAECDVVLPRRPAAGEHVFHLYAIRSSQRTELMEHLRRNGIETQVHYPIPVHRQGACAHHPSRAGWLPETDRYAAEVLSLPMYPELSTDQVDRICRAIRGFALVAG